jgi:SAM-dependent methyltransferase
VKPSPEFPAKSTGDWDAFASLWIAQGAQRVWRRHHDAVNLRFLTRWLPSGAARVLKTDLFDEAVGEGLYATLAAHARSVVGVDISRVVATAAATRHPSLRASVGDVRRLPFDDESFDVVVSDSTLDHFSSVDEIATALAELRRVMMPGGTLILTLDNLGNPFVALRAVLPRSAFDFVWGRFGRLAARIAPNPPGVTFGIRRLERLVSAAGFRVCERGSILHCPRVWAVLAADQLEQRGSPRAEQRFLDALLRFEALEALPTRFVTGHFVTVRAVR